MVENFLSFRERTTFTLAATEDQTLEEFLVRREETAGSMLRVLALIGANGAGKSNLLAVLEFLKRFWTRVPQSSDEPTGVVPFMYDPECRERPSEIKLYFCLDEVFYVYVLVADRKKVYSEGISIFYNYSPVKAVGRRVVRGAVKATAHSLLLNPDSIRQLLLTKCLPNMSIMAVGRATGKRVDLIDEVGCWMARSVRGTDDLSPEKALPRLSCNRALCDEVAVLAQKLGLPVTAIGEGKTLWEVPVRLKVKMDDELKECQMTAGQLSHGEQRLLCLVAAAIETVKEEGFLIVDHLENYLHPAVIEELIAYFAGQKGHSQMLIATHYDSLLDTVGDLLRNDCIAFVERKASGVTQFQRLSNYRRTTALRSLTRAYRNGRFGALPEIY